jgi:hypothetical protein
MILVKKLCQYDSNNIYFSYPMKNNVMNNGNFTKIFYSLDMFILNGLYFKLNLDISDIEYYINKKILYFNLNEDNMDIINLIKNIEKDILSKSSIFNKICNNLLYKQLMKGKIKIHSDNSKNKNKNIILKISGIWEDETSYGLNFKFMFY